MKPTIDKTTVPNNSLVNSYPLRTDYVDVFYIRFDNDRNETIDYFAKSLLDALPSWSLILFKIRNFLVKFVGLEGGDIIEMIEKCRNSDCQVGSKIGLFTVHSRNNTEIMFAEKDKHLDFAGSLYLNSDDKNPNIFNLGFITKVQFNIKLGNFYFFCIKPFHKLIVKSILKRMIRNYYADK